jgi:hypothetical protein
MSVHTDRADMAAALAQLHHLQECIIRRIAWSEPAMQLTVELDYIWTDDGFICFTKREQARRLTLTFEHTSRVVIDNALSDAMIEHPEKLDWGISEIARLDLDAAQDDVSSGFILARFRWEGARHIDVSFQKLNIVLE